MVKLLKFVLAAAAVLGMIALAAIVDGYVGLILYNWFLLPFGLPTLSLPVAIGISLTLRHIINTNKYTEDKRPVAEKVAHVIMYPLAALAMGWISLQFV